MKLCALFADMSILRLKKSAFIFLTNHRSPAGLIALSGVWAAACFSQALLSVFLILALIIWIFFLVQEKRGPWHSIPIALGIPFAFFMAWCLLTLMWSEYPSETLQGIRKLFSYTILFLVVPHLMRDSRTVRGGFVFLLIWSLCVSLDGAWQYIEGYDLFRHLPAQDHEAGRRICACFKSYSLFGAYLLLTFPFLIAFLDYCHCEKKWKLVLGTLLTIVLHLLAIYWTRSRAVWICFLMVYFLALVFQRRWKWLLAFILLISAGAALLPRAAFIHRDIHQRDQSSLDRLYLWERAVRVIQAKPITGTGLNTYTRSHGAYDQRKKDRVVSYYAHNGYLQTAAEIGLPGLVFFLWFLVAYFGYAFKRLRTLPSPPKKILIALLVGILSTLCLAALDTIMHNLTYLTALWWLLGYGLSIMNTSQTCNSQSS